MTQGKEKKEIKKESTSTFKPMKILSATRITVFWGVVIGIIININGSKFRSQLSSETMYENFWSYLPIQNLPKMLDNTSSDMSSPLICPRANAASLKSIVQKSRGISSSIDVFSLTKASFARRSCSHCLCFSKP